MKIYKFGYFGYDEGYHYFLKNDKEYSDSEYIQLCSRITCECMTEYRDILRKELLEEQENDEIDYSWTSQVLTDDQLIFNDVDSLVLEKLINIYGFEKIEENVSFYICTNYKILDEKNDSTKPIRKEYLQYVRAEKLRRINEKD
jgi:hypothetical protein